MKSVDAPWTLADVDFDLATVWDLRRGHAIAVVIPAQNEATTIGGVIDAVAHHEGFVDHIIVVDDHSRDDTASVAARHGARVLPLRDGTGKGEALAAGVAAIDAEIVVFLDGDVLNPGVDYVARMVQPLLERPDVHLVKGYYERPLLDMPRGGGRVNELTARPILSLLYSGLGDIRQPLAGETAIRHETLDALTLESAYGVEIALLIDVAQKFGVGSLAQVDLGVRRHRNRPLEELRPMATEVLKVALDRFHVDLPARG
ncbi:MAG: glucosyl-3-phosphoglycerate synthase [Acidobacteria bacterium]|nr:glucosyl-3-phosphoglycerate synthase [Acidobacteriota bacterium]